MYERATRIFSWMLLIAGLALACVLLAFSKSEEPAVAWVVVFIAIVLGFYALESARENAGQTEEE